MAKALAEQFSKQNRIDFSEQFSTMNSLKDVMPKVNEMIKPVSVTTAMQEGSAISSGNEND